MLQLTQIADAEGKPMPLDDRVHQMKRQRDIAEEHRQLFDDWHAGYISTEDALRTAGVA